MKKLISKEQYEEAKGIIKMYELQEERKLPFERGHIFFSSTRWAFARRMKDTQEVFIEHNNIFDRTLGTQLQLLYDPKLIKSFKSNL
jgi:hypothetical protein